jgi:hypothetical protein
MGEVLVPVVEAVVAEGLAGAGRVLVVEEDAFHLGEADL